MTHLTQIRFRRPALRDSQTTHRTVLAAAGSDAGRILWAAPRRDLLIIQSAQLITADRIDGVAASHSGPVHTTWTAGQPIQLSLIASPTYCQHTPGQRGKRRALPIDACDAWLRRKLGHAATLDEIEVQEMGPRTGRRHEHTVVHRLVGFHALGRVADPDALRQLQLDGVGAGKAYGAGLLLVSAA